MEHDAYEGSSWHATRRFFPFFASVKQSSHTINCVEEKRNSLLLSYKDYKDSKLEDFRAKIPIPYLSLFDASPLRISIRLLTFKHLLNVTTIIDYRRVNICSNLYK